MTLSDPGSQTVQELVRVVFARMNTRKRYPNLSRKVILKILFQAKQRLPDDNPIKDALPYYWYRDGPYSTLIYETVDRLQKDGLISESSSEYKTYSFDRSKINIPLMHSDKHMDEAKIVIDSIIDEFTHTDMLVKNVYRTAPYKWYGTYKLKFKVRFSNFCNKASSNNSTETYSREDILRELEDAVLDFPRFPDFLELRRIFMRFARVLNSFLHTDNCLEHKDMFPILDRISNSIWNVFAYGVRINHHDDYYEKNVDKWVEMYENEMARLDTDLRREQEKIKQVSTYTVRLASDIIDMKQHPERYNFEKLDIDHIIN